LQKDTSVSITYHCNFTLIALSIKRNRATKQFERSCFMHYKTLMTASSLGQRRRNWGNWTNVWIIM